MIPAFKAGMLRDEVRNLIYAARCVHSQGTAIPTEELERMLTSLMEQNLMERAILEAAEKEL